MTKDNHFGDIRYWSQVASEFKRQGASRVFEPNRRLLLTRTYERTDQDRFTTLSLPTFLGRLIGFASIQLADYAKIKATNIVTEDVKIDADLKTGMLRGDFGGQIRTKRDNILREGYYLFNEVGEKIDWRHLEGAQMIDLPGYREGDMLLWPETIAAVIRPYTEGRPLARTRFRRSIPQRQRQLGQAS